MPALSTPLLALDWGSTHLRATLLVDGEVVASARSADGIRNLAGRSCESVLAELCGAWAASHPGLRVVASGMVGAREGWREAPYVSAPCGPAELAAAALAVPSEVFGEVRIVPGVRVEDPASGACDVMRGEETQVLGLLGRLPPGEAAVCLPGTHSKWVRCREGRIVGFRTWLTGEAYERLTTASLIAGDGSPADPAGEGFALGVAAAEGEGGLLHQLFLARTAMLAGRLLPGEVRSFVSGLLVAHELRAALGGIGAVPILLVGDSPAAEATAAGLRLIGRAFERDLGDAHLGGILALGEWL
jgi:2-dehydro-3-deoxygalactonokinase